MSTTVVWPPTMRRPTRFVLELIDGDGDLSFGEGCAGVAFAVLWLAAAVCVIVTLVLSCQHIGKANGDEVAWHKIALFLLPIAAPISLTTWIVRMRRQCVVKGNRHWHDSLSSASDYYRDVARDGSDELQRLAKALVKELTVLRTAHPNLTYSEQPGEVYVEQDRRLKALRELAAEARRERVAAPIVGDTTLLAVEATLAARAELKQIMCELP